MILLFHTPDWMSEQWLGTADSIAITFVVFIMGVPALIFQTFIAGSLRDVYNERLGKGWTLLFFVQLFLIMVLFALSNSGIYQDVLPKYTHNCLPWVVISVLITVLGLGFYSLVKNFKSSRNIEKQLSEKIARDAVLHFKKNNQKALTKDLEDLGVLAQELRSGRVKNDFLKECEFLVEFLLNVPQKQRDPKLIAEILTKVVCLSVTYDGAQFNQENMRKALEILGFTCSYTQHFSSGDTSASYLNTIIGNCMREIGIQAMQKADQRPVVMLAMERLSAIEATSNEMFILGNEALRQGHVQPAVGVIRKLGGKVRGTIAQGEPKKEDDKRTFYFWIGLVAKVSNMGNSARQFARRRLQTTLPQHTDAQPELLDLIREAQLHFYKMADFETADAVQRLEYDLTGHS
ncbi:MAG: hypothetical protein ACKVU2_09495 [Saprospiraceae bacterium]